MPQEKSIIQDHYGCHKAPNGLWFLLQDGEAQNARGLDVRNPFVVYQPRGHSCTHRILLDNRSISRDDRSSVVKLLSDEVGSLFLPLPDNAGKVVFLEKENWMQDKFLHLSKLTSPTYPIASPSWATSQSYLKRMVRHTNVQPLVITDVDVKWMTKNQSYISLFASNGTRPLILVGREDVILPSFVKRIKNSTLYSMGFDDPEASGAQVLRSYMRGELHAS